ncbi:MAG TPA: AraC family transcriptional regulator [Chitinophagaceae bacterium]|nr:AraC family transcriptional regulator [Chitinophagaceae bacterium]
MRYLIKNIISNDCRIVVIKHLDNLGISYKWVGPGLVELSEKISIDKESILKNELRKVGCVMHQDKKSNLADEVKSIISNMISSNEDISNIKFSFYLSKELGYHYTYLANIFSIEQGITIKQYIITQRVERIKSMMLNEELNLKQIASLLKYKSLSHLSNQFKKITGMTPSHFKKNNGSKKGAGPFIN